jgi:hypothetical protein
VRHNGGPDELDAPLAYQVQELLQDFEVTSSAVFFSPSTLFRFISTRCGIDLV